MKIKKKSYVSNREAHIKLDKTVKDCRDCPFYHERWDMGLEEYMPMCTYTKKFIDMFEYIPSWCPFLVKEEKEEDDE